MDVLLVQRKTFNDYSEQGYAKRFYVRFKHSSNTRPECFKLDSHSRLDAGCHELAPAWEKGHQILSNLGHTPQACVPQT